MNQYPGKGKTRVSAPIAWMGVKLALAASLILLAIGPSHDPRGIEALAVGQRHLEAGEYGAAIHYLLVAADHLADSEEVSLSLGRGYLGRHQTGPASTYLLRAYGQLPALRRAEAAALLAWTEWHQNNASGALWWWEHALKYDPSHHDARLALASALDMAGEQGEAAYHLRLLLLQEPEHEEATYRLGLVLLDLNPPAAIAVLEQASAVDRDNTNKEATHRLTGLLMGDDGSAYDAAQIGLALLQLREAHAALRQFERALSRDATYAPAHAYRGHILAVLGRPAINDLRLAIRLQPDLVLGHYFLGRYYHTLGLSTKARESYLEALALSPDNPALGIDIAHTYADEGAYALAEAWVEAAMERAPGDKGLALARARFYIDRGFKVQERGLPAAELAIALAPDSAGAYQLRGLARFLTGSHAEALTDLHLAVELAPHDAAARLSLGEALLQAGERQEGVRQLERAIDLDPVGTNGSRAEYLLSQYRDSGG